MCGIAGIIRFDGAPVDPAVLAAMSDAIAHRGPDGEGLALIAPGSGSAREYAGPATPPELAARLPDRDAARPEEGYALGLAHRRFSIVDPTPAGHQPFFDARRRACAVYNGEVYNWIELREELRRAGVEMRTSCDTEALVEGWVLWGPGVFERLNGMWAVALWDFDTRRLILSRDRLGRKPLYWTRAGDALCFASEIKALLEIPEVDAARAVEPTAVVPYLVQGLRDLDGETFFAGIHSLPAGSWAEVTPEFPATVHRFWRVPETRLGERDIGVVEAARAVRETFEDAVRLRLRADVDWGIELSGGLDSSALLAAVSRAHGSPARTYTVRFDDADCNEVPFAESVGRRYGADMRFIDAGLRGFWRHIEPFTRLQEEPYHCPNLHISQAIWRRMRAEGTKVVLTGAAGDEIFAGYGYYFAASQLESVCAGRLGHYLRNALEWTERSNVARALVSCFARPLRIWLRGRCARRSWLRCEGRPARHELGRLSPLLLSDITNTRLPYWQRSGDKTQMGIPIEARAPFLDHRVVELAFTLPSSYLVRDGWHKWILRKAFESELPADVVWRRRKMGFPFPWQRFFAESEDIVAAILARSRQSFVAPTLPADLATRWRIVSLLLWHERFIHDDASLLEHIETLTGDAEGDGVPAGEGFRPAFLDGPRAVLPVP